MYTREWYCISFASRFKKKKKRDQPTDPPDFQSNTKHDHVTIHKSSPKADPEVTNNKRFTRSQSIIAQVVLKEFGGQ